MSELLGNIWNVKVKNKKKSFCDLSKTGTHVVFLKAEIIVLIAICRKCYRPSLR